MIGRTSPVGEVRIGEVWSETDPDLLPHSDLAALRDYWAGKRCDGDDLPRYGAIDPLELKPHLGHLFVARMLDDRSDFRYRLIGTAIAQAHGVDFTGRTVADALGTRQPGFARDVIRAYKVCLREGVPLLAGGKVVWTEKDFLDFRALHLPCSSDGTRRDIVFGKFIRVNAG